MRTLAILNLSLLTLLSAPTLAADLENGLTAVRRGDYATAVREWTPFAEEGDAKAQALLGLMYDKGFGVERDYATAVEWVQLAAEQRFADAQHNLGAKYALGQGVIQDYLKAHMWGNIAKSNGSANAEKLLTLLEERMPASQISEAQAAARDCAARDYKGC